jgi:hypothetical protein
LVLSFLSVGYELFNISVSIIAYLLQKCFNINYLNK